MISFGGSLEECLPCFTATNWVLAMSDLSTEMPYTGVNMVQKFKSWRYKVSTINDWICLSVSIMENSLFKPQYACGTFSLKTTVKSFDLISCKPKTNIGISLCSDHILRSWLSMNDNQKCFGAADVDKFEFWRRKIENIMMMIMTILPCLSGKLCQTVWSVATGGLQLLQSHWLWVLEKIEK